jgi:hypothetical protein
MAGIRAHRRLQGTPLFPTSGLTHDRSARLVRRVTVCWSSWRHLQAYELTNWRTISIGRPIPRCHRAEA